MKLEDEVYYDNASSAPAKKFYLNGLDIGAAKQLVALIFSTICMAAFQGMNQHIYRKHRRYLLAPSEDDVSNKFLSTISQVGGCIGCIISIILSSCSGFNGQFMSNSHVDIKNIKFSKSIDTLYSFMMTTAIIQGILPLI